MIQRVKILIFFIILNIVVVNNNIKINYNTNQMRNIIKTNTTNTTKPGTKSKKEKDSKIILENNKPNTKTEVKEIAIEWVLKKEDDINKETSIFMNVTRVLKKKLENVSIRPNTIHLVIKYIMELVEETPIEGVEQKEFALKVMRELFKDLTEGEDEIVLLKLLDDGSISNLIDLVVDATNGKLNVNTVIETSVSCIGTCLPYLTRKDKKQNK